MQQKGIGLKSVLTAIERLHGKPVRLEVEAAVAPEFRDRIRVVRPLDWYPVEMTSAMHAAIRDVLGKGQWSESHRISLEAARLELNGVYRLFLSTLGRESVWERVERGWRLYNDAGEFRWVAREAKHATARITGVRGFNTGLWNSVAGRIQGLLAATGAKDARVVLAEHAPEHARLDATWS